LENPARIVGKNSTKQPVRQRVITLFLLNGVSFLVVGLSYFFYSRLLAPEQFGLYSIALVVGNLGVLILDGGLKNSIIKAPKELSVQDEGTLFFFMAATSLLLICLLLAIERPLSHYYPTIQHDYRFLAFFGALYLVSYPLIALPTAWLERQLEYGRIAWVEAIGTMLERAAPVFFLVWSNEGVYSFLWGLLLGRLYRIAIMVYSHRLHMCIPSLGRLRRTLHLITEGGWLQIATGISLTRDNLHVLIVGPFFGKEWVGYYAWGLQLCLIGSQVFVGISARVSLPLFAQADSFVDQWKQCLYQIRILTMLTGPLLAAILIVIPDVDREFFQGKWVVAIGILPLLFLRMLPSLSTTPLGTLTMVHSGGRKFARANFFWTLAELGGAILFLLMLGPTGLAWSYAIVAWIGLGFFLLALDERKSTLVGDLADALVIRPSLGVVAVALVLLFFVSLWRPLSDVGMSLVAPAAFLMVATAYLTERDVRQFLSISL
jgi:O-antigen/teichoic acid export membrane protein